MFQYIFLAYFLLHVAFAVHVINYEKYSSYCYAQDDNPYKFYGTKTAYELVHGDKFDGRIPSM